MGVLVDVAVVEARRAGPEVVGFASPAGGAMRRVSPMVWWLLVFAGCFMFWAGVFVAGVMFL